MASATEVLQVDEPGSPKVRSFLSISGWAGLPRGSAFLALALTLCGARPCSAQDVENEPRMPTTQDSVYTSEQAARGKQVYQRACVACHTLDFYQGETLRSWEGTPIFGLYDLIRTRMPESNPGSLKSREYVDVIAYILEINGMPPGESALRPRASMLKNILIKWSTDS